MDCTKTVDFIKEKYRMCNSSRCKDCNIGILKNGKNVNCETFVMEYIEESIKIVQEWSNSHPVKTRLSVLKERYPNVVLNKDDGLPYDVCAGVLYGFETCEGEGNWDCTKCWNTPIEQGMQ